MRKPNPIIVLLYIQNSHTKMQEKYGSKKTHAINLAKFCYFVIFGHLWPIIHSIRRKWRHSHRELRINWSMTNKEREWSLNVQ